MLSRHLYWSTYLPGLWCGGESIWEGLVSLFGTIVCRVDSLRLWRLNNRHNVVTIRPVDASIGLNDVGMWLFANLLYYVKMVLSLGHLQPYDPVLLQAALVGD